MKHTTDGRTRICFLNPFGTDRYDDLIKEVLSSSLRDTTELDIWHLHAGPRNLDYYAPKQVVQVEILRAAKAAEAAGYDALVIGCLYDPALTEARELVKIPVIGPLEASTAQARMFGHRYAIVTDHHKAVPELEDRLRIYGTEANCRSVEAVGWFVDDMVKDTDAVATDTYAVAQEALKRTGAEAILIGCTIVSACYELAVQRGRTELADLPVINPNLIAVKTAEMFADMNKAGQYRIARNAYYQNLADHNPAEADDVAPYFETDIYERTI
ncbi:aspartate/glutamate racemase family protein [Arthrobacter sp. M4]|uniref:aspartate/glutamate racemase family protein n=1 Tax=Arthrobacter sp. M4 TaxID=218160 RepID=UPI001CDD0D46|nr:aspartate/glutamate racemase family protein [Arthrobacter sp. M4]MCA4134825.1 aspartate/glutamate racemase family protein [Arthrobacter sp. M4]